MAMVKLSQEDEEFLAQAEEELKDRYTEKDEEFMKVFKLEPSVPPIMENWYPPSGRRNNFRRQYNDCGPYYKNVGGYHDNRDSGYHGNRDGGYYNNRDSGYHANRDRGYHGNRDRRYHDNRDIGDHSNRNSGYHGNRDSGYSGNRDSGATESGEHDNRDRGYKRGYNDYEDVRHSGYNKSNNSSYN